MITALDTNVLLDVFSADPTFGERSRAAVRGALAEGGLIACEVVWAEASAAFPTPADAMDAMTRLGVRFVPLDAPTAAASGQAWRAYRKAGGARSRIMSDFLIGAHAATNSDRLLTRDRGFFRKYFDALTVSDPSTIPD